MYSRTKKKNDGVKEHDGVTVSKLDLIFTETASPIADKLHALWSLESLIYNSLMPFTKPVLKIHPWPFAVTGV